MGSLSTWAGGSKSDGIGDTGSKSAGTGETEQPESAGKNGSKPEEPENGAKNGSQPDEPELGKNTAVKRDQTGSSKSDETGETEKLGSKSKTDRTDGTGEAERSESTGRTGSKSDEESVGNKNPNEKKSQTDSSKSEEDGSTESPHSKNSSRANESVIEKARDQKVGEPTKKIPKAGESRQEAFVPIIRTLEANVEKDGAYLFGGKILADGASTILGAGIEFSQSMSFKKTFKIPFELKDGISNYRVKTRKLDPGSIYYYRAYVRNAVGVNRGSVKRLEVPESAGKRGWWNEGDELGADWRRSPWFGTFRKQEGIDWVYHQKLGWTYVVSDQRDGLWLWQEENGWTWTQKGAWPCLWHNKTGTWLFLMGAIEGKPVFYDYAARKVRNGTKKQDKTDKSKVTEEKAKSEKKQASKELDRKTGQASKEKVVDKVSGKTTDSNKLQENTSDRPAPGASETDTAKLLDRIDKNNLPEDYRAKNHQPYVDLIVAGLESDQRARLSQLWKEKLRIDPDMPNRGASFVRILTHVSGEAGKSKHPVDSKSGGNETSDSKTNGLDSPGSRNSDSFTGETTQSDTQKSSR